MIMKSLQNSGMLQVIARLKVSPANPQDSEVTQTLELCVNPGERLLPVQHGKHEIETAVTIWLRWCILA